MPESTPRPDITGAPNRHRGRIKYTHGQKAEAVALAALVGAEEAASVLGFDRRSVIAWSEQMGKRPELDAPPDELRGLRDLALAKVKAAVVAGKMSPVTMMTIVGISERNLREAAKNAPPPEPPRTRTERAVDEVEAYLVATVQDDTALLALMDAYSGVRTGYGGPGPDPDRVQPDISPQEAAEFVAWGKAWIDAGNFERLPVPVNETIPEVVDRPPPPDFGDLLRRAEAALSE